MKRFILTFCALLMGASLFAQADLQVLAVVKLNNNESITLKKLKTRVEAYQKQTGAALSVDDRKKVLDALIQEELVAQAAIKSGMTIPDSTIEEYFLQSVSQQIGRRVTQQQFEELVQKQEKMTIDEYMKKQAGMSYSEYKNYMKNQLLSQNYIVAQSKSELEKVAPTDEEIRGYYELNKTNFVQPDMMKMFLVIIPKGNDVAAAKAKAEKLYSDLKDKKASTTQILKDSKTENSGYQAGDVFINKNELSAKQLGISLQDLLALFANSSDYVSPLSERETSYQFYSVIKKYEGKMLTLSDLVQPETTRTVYDFIKDTVGQQKKMQFLQMEAQKIAQSLDKSANVDRKKTGKELEKLLAW